MMTFLIVVLIFVSTALGQTEESKQPSPDCGRLPPAPIPLSLSPDSSETDERIPWSVGIYKKNNELYNYICGGTLVSDKIVISAAHCFWNENKMSPASPEDYAVAAGKLYAPWNDALDFNAQKSDISEIKIEPYYRGNMANYQSDIAVILLTTPMVINEFVRPACINFQHDFEKIQLTPGNEGKVVGRGRTHNGISQKLKVINIPIISIAKCLEDAPKDFKAYITADKICVGNKNGTGITSGYGGAGLALPYTVEGSTRYYLRGVISSAPRTEDFISSTICAVTQLSKHYELITNNLS